MSLVYRPEIDGLRAIAVTSVILFHAGIKSFSGGFIGVDVFFVISGFLITSILLEDLSSKSFSFSKFYERRARRIFPALFFVLIFSVCLGWFFAPPPDYSKFFESLISIAAFSSNFFFLNNTGYFDTRSELLPTLHTWSLAVEEQFYFLFPIVLWFLREKKLKLQIFAIIGIFVSSLAVSRFGGFSKEAIFYMLPFRAWELLAGSIAAYAHRAELHKKLSTHWRGIFCNLGFFLICTSVFTFSNKTNFPTAYFWGPILGTALVVVFGGAPAIANRILSNKVFVGLGLMSYSSYLIHQPLFAFARMQWGVNLPAHHTLILLIFTQLLAFFSWRFIESPFRNSKVFSKKLIFQMTLAGSFFLIGIGFIGDKTQGFQTLRGDKTSTLPLETIQASPMRGQCHTGGPGHLKAEEACSYFGKKITWAVFGDSHAVELAYTLAKHLEVHDEGIKHYSFSSCGPLWFNGEKFDLKGCELWGNRAREIISQNAEIKNVLVTFRLNSHFFGDHIETYPEVPKGNPHLLPELVWENLLNLIKYFQSANKTVYLILQAPEIPAHISSLLHNQKPIGGIIAGVPRAWWEKRNDFVLTRLKTLPKGTRVVDPADLFCDSVNCLAVVDSRSLYFDDNHMSLTGAKKVIDHLFELWPRRGD